MSILSPAGWLYGRIADLRNSLYVRGVFASHSLGARTISIGNLTAGGTGKTPLVAYVAEILTQNGEKVCILTRGYGRKNPRERVLVSNFENVLADARTGGDEPVDLATKLIGRSAVIADANRVSAARQAVESLGATVLVLDDGFQHRRAKRDLDIVCIDATNPFGNKEVLPAGSLREPMKNLRRADAVVITRSNLVDDRSSLRAKIIECAGNIPVFESSNKISGMMEISEFKAVAEKGSKALAFCALGNPSTFFNQLTLEGYDLVSKKPFPDHHYYRKDEIMKLERKARTAGAEILLTTAKDAVKLVGFEFGMPCFVVGTKLSFDDSESFNRLITSSS